MAKLTLEEAQKRYPVGTKVSFVPGKTSPTRVTAEVTGVRQAGQPGTKGFSIFVDTREDLGEGKAKERSVRPATLTAA